MKLLKFTGYNDSPVYIVAEKITGFCIDGTDTGMVFIATGADGPDGGANGWSVKETIDQVAATIEGSNLPNAPDNRR